MTDLELMELALEEARAAAAEGEVPVGAVLEYRGAVLARDHNRMIGRKDALAHAELLTLQAAALQHPHKWLLESSLFVTLEPCVMCAGALVLARVKRLVYAAPDPKAGACGGRFNLIQQPHLNHRVQVQWGIRQQESAELLKQFFRQRRKTGE
jgi:tRNA(adenine34) deaminase